MHSAHPILLLAAAPYICALLVDGALHDKARRVPRREQYLHGLLAVNIIVFLGAAFAMRVWLGVAALALLLPLIAADELIYHRGLARLEHAVHVFSWAALGLFASIWGMEIVHGSAF